MSRRSSRSSFMKVTANAPPAKAPGAAPAPVRWPTSPPCAAAASAAKRRESQAVTARKSAAPAASSERQRQRLAQRGPQRPVGAAAAGAGADRWPAPSPA